MHLDVVEQLVDPDVEHFECQFAAVSETEIHRCVASSRRHAGRLELAPAVDDLLEFLAARRVGPPPESLDRFPPCGSRTDVLLPVLEDAGQQVGRLAGRSTPSLMSRFPQQGDVVVLGR